jgi:ABC-type sugar transport system substrate-binding protein
MRRRDFIAAALSAGCPFGARAQQAGLPVVGFVNPTSPAGYPEVIKAFRVGLQESGFVEGRNVAVEYRWAEGRIDRLPELLADLVQRRVNVIVATGGDSAALAAKIYAVRDAGNLEAPLTEASRPNVRIKPASEPFLQADPRASGGICCFVNRILTGEAPRSL